MPNATAASLTQTKHTRLKRFHQRGDYTLETINSILDEALICHMGFVHEGRPFVIPTAFGRVGDRLYLHGSSASRALRTLATGIEACITVTLTDGLVLARSAFNHSFNYRSVVVLGTAAPVIDPDEKELAVQTFTERLVPGRWADVRWPTRTELKATSVLTMPITEASAKVRVGPPADEGLDLEHDAWAGVIPFETAVLPPLPDPKLPDGFPVPDYVSAWQFARSPETGETEA
jgi:nitroimidazol reductase NimA-like FMN-containing flavoprotein (pyridoxamine 5'-phosphate oxidase superfamily)